MNFLPTEIIDLNTHIENITDVYKNIPVTEVNNHVVRLAVMTEDFYWHYHPNSDETFMVIEGTLLLDFENGTIELNKGQLITVPKNVAHRTRPKDGRSVNLTIELTAMETVRIERE
ncbi:cupin domain-containing protein [Mucilaginibacter sp. UYCu711]|uniref:cupin domain-containing protein n=1 Tax=Mucilaginibacter sp. UYCu711 TaxID=3156339 RepID=UPI003D21782A